MVIISGDPSDMVKATGLPNLKKGAEKTQLEHSVRIKTHMLPIRVIADVVIASAVQDGIDGRSESGVRDGRTTGHGLESQASQDVSGAESG